MDFSFAAAKALLRREVHSYFGVEAFYQDASLIAPIPVMARYHFKKYDAMGDLVEAGYAKVVEGIETIVLIPTDTCAVTFMRDGRVTLPSLPGVEFILQVRDPQINSIEQVWQVVRA